MDFIDEIKALGGTIPKLRDHLKTEEATKQSLVLPFIRILGYNIFDPSEVVPEFSADFGTAISDKVDYAIFMQGKPIILFECKWAGKVLEKKDEDQLRKYFAACSDARIGVVTNGIRYLFFTDLEKPNMMDERPFLEFDLLDIKELLVEELKKLTRAGFDAQVLADSASELKYTKEIKTTIDREFAGPSEEFVKFFAGEVYPGKKITQKVLEQFTGLTKKALTQYMKEKIDDTLKRALKGTEPSEGPVQGPVSPTSDLDTPSEEEKEAFHIVRAILCETVPPERIEIRKKKSACAILFDDSQQKPICRLYFENLPWSVGVLDEKKTETKHAIEQLSDIYKCSAQLKQVAGYYLNAPKRKGPVQNDEEKPPPDLATGDRPE